MTTVKEKRKCGRCADCLRNSDSSTEQEEKDNVAADGSSGCSAFRLGSVPRWVNKNRLIEGMCHWRKINNCVFCCEVYCQIARKLCRLDEDQLECSYLSDTVQSRGQA